MTSVVEVLVRRQGPRGTARDTWVEIDAATTTVDDLAWSRLGLAWGDIDWPGAELRRDPTPACADLGRGYARGDHHLRVRHRRFGTVHAVRVRGHRRIRALRTRQADDIDDLPGAHPVTTRPARSVRTAPGTDDERTAAIGPANSTQGWAPRGPQARAGNG